MIPEAAVEAAAERTWLDSEQARRSGGAWAALSELQQTLRRARALRILEVAAPHIRAQALEDAAAEVDEGVPAHGQEQYAGWLRTRAEQIRPTP